MYEIDKYADVPLEDFEHVHGYEFLKLPGGELLNLMTEEVVSRDEARSQIQQGLREWRKRSRKKTREWEKDHPLEKVERPKSERRPYALIKLSSKATRGDFHRALSIVGVVLGPGFGYSYSPKFNSIRVPMDASETVLERLKEEEIPIVKVRYVVSTR